MADIELSDPSVSFDPGELLGRDLTTGSLRGYARSELYSILVALGLATQAQLNALAASAGNLPAGGTTAQVVAKASNADFDVEWVDQTGAGGTWGSITGTLASQTDLQAALAALQPLDSDLTAIAALSTTSFGRSVLALADAAALRTLAGLVIGTNVQAYDQDLQAISGLASAANKIVRYTGSGTADLIDFKDEDNMVSDSATAVPSQQSVKAYIDNALADVVRFVGQTTSEVGYGDTLPVTGTEGDAFDLIDLG